MAINPARRDTPRTSVVKVTLRSNESIDSALKRFKRVCNNQGIFTLVKRAAFYEKPSEKRRRKVRERLKNIRKMMALESRGFVKKRRKPKNGRRPAATTADSSASSSSSSETTK